jgi:hypothetical protein
VTSSEWVAAVLVGVVSVARTARLLIYDDFPPMVWLRVRFLAMFSEDNSWSKIAECPFCVSPYLAAGMLGLAWLAWNGTGLDAWWWVVNGIWAGSYLAAILVSYDQPD